MVCLSCFHFCFYRNSGFSAITSNDIPERRDAKMYVIHKMRLSPCYWKGHEHDDGFKEARETPRTGRTPAARNPRSVPRASADHLLAQARRTWLVQAGPSARKFFAAWPNRRRKNGSHPG